MNASPPAGVHTPVQAGVDCMLALTGTLSRHAHVAMKQVDSEGQFVPVIELHLDDVGAGHNRVVAQIPFLPEQHAAAEEVAKRLHRGQRVTVTTPLTDIRMLLPAASLSTDSP